MKSILFIDMLGARRRWQEGGVKLSRSTFTKFKKLIVSSARNTAPDDILSGGIETDSAMIVCSTLLSAVHLAKDIYLTAFKTKNHASAPRIWLRGWGRSSVYKLIECLSYNIRFVCHANQE